MRFLLFLKFILSCDLQYTLSSHDPLYIEQILQPGQTLCINTTIEYTIFIFNSLDNSTFKTFDQYNIEKPLGYKEMFADAAAVSFGKMIGSLVISNLKNVNKSSLSFISVSAISFPKDECEIKIISNQLKNFVIFSFDDSTVCYFNGNGINYRYQFYVSSGTIEIRPPRNISEKVLLTHDLNSRSSLLNVKSMVKNIFFNFLSKSKRRKDLIKFPNSIDSPESIFIDHNLTKRGQLDSPSSFVRVDGYSPLLLYKPAPNSYKPAPDSYTTLERTYFMELGTNNRQYPYKLEMRFISNEPGIITSNKETYDEKDPQNIFYGCDPYIFIYDSEGKKQVIDPDGRTVASYYLELFSNVILVILSFYVTQIALIVYFLSFCCICPCCCCYKCCHQKCCCRRLRHKKYRSFNARNEALNFLQAPNVNNDANNNEVDSNNINNYDDNNIVENNGEDSAYSINENQNQTTGIIEEEEEANDDDPINNVEDGLELHDIGSNPIRDAKPQL